MDRKINSRFIYKGQPLEVVHEPEYLCKGCFFRDEECWCAEVSRVTGSCESCCREDGKDVIFRRIETIKEKEI